MISEADVRQKLADFLCHRLSLDDFEDWLVRESWNMHRDSAPGAVGLVASIELLLAEYSSGHLDDNEVRDELGKLLDNAVAAVHIKVSDDIVVSPREPSHFGSNSFVVAPPGRLAVLAQA